MRQQKRQNLMSLLLSLFVFLAICFFKKADASFLSNPSFLNNYAKPQVGIVSQKSRKEKKGQIITEVVQQEKLLLDHLEEAWHVSKTVWHQSRAVIMLAYGSILLFYGWLFPAQVYAITMFKAAGMRSVRRGWKELEDSWRETRKVVKEEMPHLQEAKRLLAHLNRDIADLKKVMQNIQKEKKLHSKMDHEKHTALEDAMHDSRKEMKRLTHEANRLAVAANSIDHILDVMDPENIFEVAEGIYFTFASFIVGATRNPFSSNIKAASYGANIAETMAHTLDAVFHPLFREDGMLHYLPPQTVNAIRSGIRGIVYIKSILFALLAQQLSSRVNTCVLGASLVVESVGEIQEHFLPHFGLEMESIQAVELRAALVVGLTAAGLYFQGKMMTHGLPKVVEKMLQPLLKNEQSLEQFCESSGLNMLGSTAVK